MAKITHGFLAFCSQDTSKLKQHDSIKLVDKLLEQKGTAKSILGSRTVPKVPESIPHRYLEVKSVLQNRSKRKQVHFAETLSMREFSVFQSHEMVVPSVGAYPIGLGDLLGERTRRIPEEPDGSGIESYLPRRHPCNDKRYLLPKISEKERIKWLKVHNAFRSKEGVTECDATRKSRMSNFCQCHAVNDLLNCCVDDSCPCYASGVNCHVEGPRFCSCTFTIFNSDDQRTPRSSSDKTVSLSLPSPSIVSSISTSLSHPETSVSTTIESSTPDPLIVVTVSSPLSAGCLNPNGRYTFNETEAKRKRISLLGKALFSKSPQTQEGETSVPAIIPDIRVV